MPPCRVIASAAAPLDSPPDEILPAASVSAARPALAGDLSALAVGF
jgi:hypothetical protein